MSLFGRIIGAGLSAVHAAKSETVRYVTETDGTIEDLQAAPTRPDNSSQLTDVAIDEAELDWIVAVDDLAIGEVSLEPARGHMIEWEYRGTVRVYELLPRATDAVYRFRDSGHTQYRLHTKLIEVR